MFFHNMLHPIVSIPFQTFFLKNFINEKLFYQKKLDYFPNGGHYGGPPSFPPSPYGPPSSSYGPQMPPSMMHHLDRKK